MDNFRTAYNQGAESLRQSSKLDNADQLLFPRDFKDVDIKRFVAENLHIFDIDSLSHQGSKTPKLIRSKYKDQTSSQVKSSYKDHEFTIFDSKQNIDLDLNKCEVLKSNKIVQIDDPVNMKTSLKNILTRVAGEIDEGSNHYLNAIAPYFIKELKQQLKHDVVNKFWYRLSGSSVWLEQYGVHLLVSRIGYSDRAVRNQPIFSISYAQLFDHSWKEMMNTSLIVPSNDYANESDPLNHDPRRSYKVLAYPHIIPIPFYQDANSKAKYLGPEDSHASLVKNKNGYEEPLIVYNSVHRKYSPSSKDDDKDGKSRVEGYNYRSMFVCWPWQFQVGKENVDGKGNKEYDKKIYTRVMELQIKNNKRQQKQKNWVPLISHSDRVNDGYDKNLYFTYRWANFEILKCDISLNSGQCVFDYRLDPEIDPGASVGPLRGGTQMVNVNEIIATQHPKFNLEKLIPTNREIWLGFPRAHLADCGCGDRMYRPNLVVMVRDSITMTEDGKEVVKNIYKTTHVSSFITFDVPIIGWDLAKPTEVCTGMNILLPNGISSWNIKSIEKKSDSNEWHSEDYMTLMFALSDFTVHRMNIKGFLSLLLKLDKPSLFLSPDENSTIDEATEKARMKDMGIPEMAVFQDPKKKYTEELIGYNNDNIVCALESSTKFCAEYGKDYKSQGPSSNEDYNNFINENDIDESVDKIAEYNMELKQES